MAQVSSNAYFLVGPTAVGKSSVAQWIAENYHYDILSADSMLVYKGMDIGTAKPSKENRTKVRYYGVDLVDPDETFSVGHYYRHACTVLNEIVSGNRKVIVAGGTGLYVKSLTHGFSSLPENRSETRAHWARVLSDQGVTALQQALREKNKAVYEALEDNKNARRLIRALEMTEAGMKELPSNWEDDAGLSDDKSRDKSSARNCTLTGLMLPTEQLLSKIEKRVKEMFEQGLVEEVKTIIDQYGDLSNTAKQAIGYSEVGCLLEGKCSLSEAIERTVIRTRQLAKKQKTWFRHQADVKWINIDINMKTRDIAEQVLACWEECGPVDIQ
ncbi:tRNA (adenosine(37)-N6)-dimethylallyltransferase MiaA [Verrucomicrobiota bacterium]